MKYRIKIKEANSGEKYFSVQSKVEFNDLVYEANSSNPKWTLCIILPVLFLLTVKQMLFYVDDYEFYDYRDRWTTNPHLYNDISCAQSYINDRIRKEKDKRSREFNDKIKSTTYQKYP